jgi:hypothetical protein
MYINHLPALCRELKTVLTAYKVGQFPLIMHFNQGMEHPQFKITIERAECETFTDKNGQKWKKVN